jgi:hypothetical protein
MQLKHTDRERRTDKRYELLKKLYPFTIKARDYRFNCYLHREIFPKTKTIQMQTQPNYCAKLLLVLACTAAVLSACKRETMIDKSQVQNAPVSNNDVTFATAKTGNAPAAHIAASEKLVMPTAIELPTNLPSGNTRVATYYAEGVQQYKAREKAGSNPLAYEWVLVAPHAELYDATNAKVGTHGAGPFWQTENGAIIYGQQYSPPKTAPSPDAGSIDWLLLMPKTSTTSTGLFTDVLYIQRIATKGGKAPSTAPTAATETVDVKYKAVYRFTKKAI